MTRKDYINIAAAIRAAQERIKADFQRQEPALSNKTARLHLTFNLQDQLRGVRRAAAHLCDFLADDNPRFDPQQFLTACGYGVGLD